MNSGQQQTQIFTEALNRLQQSISSFALEVMHHFEVSFSQLDGHYKRKYTQQVQIIDQQRVKIEEMKSCMDEFSRKTQQFLGGFFGNSKSNEGTEKVRQEKKIEIFDLRSEERINNQMVIQNPNVIQKTKQQDVQNQNQLANLKNENISIQPVLPKTPNQKKTLSHKKPISPSISEKQRPSLRCSRSHTIARISMTPNITQLNYIEYVQRRPQVFEAYDVQQLSNYELDEIESLIIEQKEMENKAFSCLTLLEWNSLRSVRIHDNHVTDIRPLQNLDLSKLDNLDISLNPLGIESAEFLASIQFSSLIYFTLSFTTGINEECWEILLQNKMKNFPKLQALEICIFLGKKQGHSNQLSTMMKERIASCMREKSMKQRNNPYVDFSRRVYRYPQNYEIKITWSESKQIYDRFTDQQTERANRRWRNAVNYECERLQRLPFVRKRKELGKGRGRGRGRPRIIRDEQQQVVVNKGKLIKKSRIKRPNIVKINNSNQQGDEDDYKQVLNFHIILDEDS